MGTSPPDWRHAAAGTEKSPARDGLAYRKVPSGRMRNYLPAEAEAPDAARVLRFWFGEPPEYGSRLKRWFDKSAEFDRQVASLFSTLHAKIAAGAHKAWLDRRADCLAYVIATDQFPRHIFRGQGAAFSTDALALAAARSALEKRFDRTLRP